ncbi:MAG: cytochrome P450 [Actinomycetota bacterium]
MSTWPTADLAIEELSGDVHPGLHRLRDQAPVAWVPAIERWLVTSRSLVVSALRDTQTYTVDDPRFTTAQVVGPSMLSLDGDEHARHREPFVLPFRRSAMVRGFADRTRTIAGHMVEDLIGSTRAGDEIDLRSGLAAPLAAETITEALGLVDTTTAELLTWYREIVAAVEAATVGQRRADAAQSAFAALAEATDRSRHTPGSLMASIDAGSGLTPQELHANTAVMLFGAIETSEGMIANALFHVLSNPEVIHRLVVDRWLVDQAVEESLRLEPAATLVDRYTTRPVRLGEVDLPERAAVALSLAGANRDPATFVDPDRFDLDRTNSGHHLAFVHGPHACIGMHLARLETSAALHAVLDALPEARLTPDAPAPAGLVFRKPERVPIQR